MPVACVSLSAERKERRGEGERKERRGRKKKEKRRRGEEKGRRGEEREKRRRGKYGRVSMMRDRKGGTVRKRKEEGKVNGTR